MNNIKHVIVCGGASHPPLDQIAELINQLADSFFLIGVDRGSLVLTQSGYHLDHAFGDFDSVSENEREFIIHHTTEVHSFPSAKDDTDMELALAWAHMAAPDAKFHLFGAVGYQVGRLDHLLANIWLAYQPRYQDIIDRLTLYHPHNRVTFLKPGLHQLKPNDKYDYLSLISMTPMQALQIRGAKYPLASTDYSYPRALISNEFLGQPVEVSFTSGLMMVILAQEDKVLEPE
ncbi:thiamine diphosphokinase [Vaginisenegalia massiliensis]|uniref:thiamine diphosphokinase n=1 Tax=Vaginisenegalia massiliensis TaxID=2058294 RepID=UPI000F51E84C|nr:thiamine diphosphokinase [Vaginisenegalia massiliensis]